ncbi:phage tail tape measure protein [Nitrosomonas marina]|uniref:Phage tail tape measure protein, TP901 family, core region n=1 Tax=Nitrosomonas marina TaxID=917 RepID=A0A1H8GIC1_9PROT|nr:phage tail tape measure protein [Nitrosomonas marina]SEN43237.1 phage tail tape measure protein, TP901 family, core region [Nitrosomonas marina]
MSALGSLVVKLALDHAEYTKGLDRNSQAALKFARDTQRTFDGATNNIKGFLTRSAGQVAALVGTVAGVSASLNTALDFDRSLAEVSTLLDGAADSTRELEFEAQRLAKQFGTMPVEQVKAFYQVISAGASDAAEATDILTAANKLAVGGVTQVDVAVDGLTSILNAYGDQVESVTAVSDTLFVGMRSGKTTIGELSTNLGKVAPIAASLNVGFDELVATVAALTKGGISTTESITGVRAILAAVAKPTKEATDLSEGLGIQFNSAGLQAKGFAGFLDEVVTKTGGSTDKLAQLFGGVEALVPVMALAGNAGQDFSDIMGQMGEKAGATEDAFNKMADSRGFKIDKLMASINSIALTLGATLADVLAPAADWAAQAMDRLFGNSGQVPAIQKQEEALAKMRNELSSLTEPTGVPILDDLYKGVFFDKRRADELAQRIEDGEEDLRKLRESLKKTSDAASDLNKPLTDLDEPLSNIPPKASSGSKSLDALTKSIQETDREAEEMQREISRLTSAYDPLIKRNEELARVAKLAAAGLRPDIADQEYIRIINEYIAATDTAADSVAEITTQTALFGEKTIDVFGTNEQFIISGMRRIQGSVADSLFNFFDDGLDGMVRSVKNAVGRIIAEFASIKLLQGSGLGALFGLGSSAALASTGGGGFNLASAGSGILDFASSGFGASNLFNSFATSGVGQNLGLSVTGPVPNFGQLTSLGSGFSAASAALAGVGIGTGLGSAIGGDRKVLGVGSATSSLIGSILGGPVGGILAGSINRLFGRKAFKFQDDTLLGNLTVDGFDGVLSERHQAKGSVFKSSRDDNIIVDTRTGELLNEFGRLSESGVSGRLDKFIEPAISQALEIGNVLDESMQQITDSVTSAAEKLGIGTESLNDFSFAVDLVTEKGQQISDADIAGVIAAASNEMVEQLLIPSITGMSRSGEAAVDTLVRVGNEFQTLENGLILAGDSAAHAREQVQALGLEKVSEIVAGFGGFEEFSKQQSDFFNNVLNESQQLEVVEERVKGVMNEIGINFIPTLDDLFKAFRSGNAELVKLAFTYDDLIVDFHRLKDAADKAAESIREPGQDFTSDDYKHMINVIGKERAAFKVARRELQTGIDRSAEIREADIRGLTERAEKQKDLIRERYELEERLLDRAKEKGGVISSFIDSLQSAARNILPDTFNDALNLVTGSINSVRGGADITSVITDRLRDSIGNLSGLTSANFSTFEEFKIAQGEAASAVNELAALGENQLSVEQLTLDQLEQQTDLLKELLDRDLNRVDSGLQFDINALDSFGGITTAGDTYKKIVANQFARTAFILENDLNPNPAAIADARSRAGIIAGTSTAQLHRSLPTGHSQFGAGLQSTDHMNRLLLEEIAKLKQAIDEGTDASKKTARILSNVTPNGNAIQTS